VLSPLMPPDEFVARSGAGLLAAIKDIRPRY
jgi:hypothetical protein